MINNISKLFDLSMWYSLYSTYFSSGMIIHIIDILVVWFVVYKLIMLLNGTKAIQVFKGIAIIIIVRIVSDFLGLTTVSWLMNQVITYGVIAAIVIFQPEVRRGLEHLGRGSILKSTKQKLDDKNKVINALDEAIQYMSKRKIGALISIENRDNLIDFVATGIRLDSDISNQLLINIFIPNTPLHDGAVIIRDGKIASACSYLPLSENILIPKEYGTRHRAAIGLSEVTDALTIIVSEETGDVSIAYKNKFLPLLSREEYTAILIDELAQDNNETKTSILNQLINDFSHGFKRGKK